MKAWVVAVQMGCSRGGSLALTFSVRETREEAIVQAVSEALAAHASAQHECQPAITMTLPHEIPPDLLREAVKAVCEEDDP